MLFADDDDDKTGYVRGLLFGGLLVFCCFILWSLCLCVFMCLGSYRVGFLAGRPEKEGQTHKALHVRRALFAIAALWLIAFCFLYYAFGVVPLQDTEDTIGNANQDVGQVLDESNAVTVAMRARGDLGDELRTELQIFLEEPFCPGYPTLQDETNVDFEALRLDTLDKLKNLDDFIDTDLVEVLDAIADAQKTVDDVEEAVDDSEDLWPGLVVMIVYIALATWMLWQMSFGWMGFSSKIFTCCTKWFTLPLFILLVFLAYILCTFSMFWVVANAGMFRCLNLVPSELFSLLSFPLHARLLLRRR